MKNAAVVKAGKAAVKADEENEKLLKLLAVQNHMS